MSYDKTEMNAFVQSLYDAKMAEGKHGHYETMFHVVHKAIERAAPAALPVGELTDGQRKAAAICLSANKVSVSMVQRTLNIGYNAAQELCQSIIDAGLVHGVTISPSLRTAAASSQPVLEPLSEDWILKRCAQSWVFETAKQWVRMAEAAHGIKGKP